MCSYKNCILSATLIAGIICGMSVPAFADSDWPVNIMAKNAPSSYSYEPSKSERMQALKYARSPFDWATAKPSKSERMQALKYAGSAIDRATAAGGEKASPYEYYMAEAYLNLAKKEFGEDDLIGVIPFAAESYKYSLMAIEKAKGGSQ